MFEKFLSTDYWHGFGSKIIEWIFEIIPSIAVLLVLLFITLKIFSFALKKIEAFVISRTPKDEGVGLEAEKRVNTLMGIIKTTVKISIYVLFTMIILKRAGIEIGPLLAGAGIVGLAVGFGAQSLVKDVISGFFLLLENEIRVGDFATVNGISGTVESIQLRSMILRDFTGTVHVIENGKIDTLANSTKEWSGAVMDIGVAYKEDIDTVLKVMQEIGDGMLNDENFRHKILNPIEVLGVSELGDSAVVIKARIKSKPHEHWGIGREYRRRIKYAFDSRGIEVPFPHTTVYWGEEIKPLKLQVEEKGKKAG